jgi:hypothetical protein
MVKNFVPEISFHFSHEPATGTYFYPGECNPYPHKPSYFFNKLSILILFFHQHPGSPKQQFPPFPFPTKICYAYLFHMCYRLCPSYLLSFDMKDFPILFFVRIFTPQCHVCSSPTPLLFRTHVRTRKPLNGFAWNFVLGTFSFSNH